MTYNPPSDAPIVSKAERTITIPVTLCHVRREMDGPGIGPHGARECRSPTGRRTWAASTWDIEGLEMGPRYRAREFYSEAEARDAIADRVREINAEVDTGYTLRVTVRVNERWISWPEAF